MGGTLSKIKESFFKTEIYYDCIFCDENKMENVVFCPTPEGRQVHSSCLKKVKEIAKDSFTRLESYFQKRGLTSCNDENTLYLSLFTHVLDELDGVRLMKYLETHGDERFQQLFTEALDKTISTTS